MLSHRFYAVIVLSFAALLLSVSPAKAYTAADYYNAGLQLYNAKNYAQAIQYFSAAIQIDPNNVGALQGRANCYYVQGQYQQALDDYQKVQAISPSPQLASMIQALQAKVGTTTPQTSAAAPPVPGAAPGSTSSPQAPDSFAQGSALFQQRQYAQAIPLFQQATRDNPKNANAYYYLGACQMQVGDMKDAAVALGISNRLNPNPSVANYVSALKARLSPDDQQWVDGQITASATASTTGISSPGANQNFGIRFEPALVLPGLGDFNAEAQAGAAYIKNAQSSYPNATYSASVPAGYPNIAFEPVLKFGPQFELGLPIAIGLVGNFTEGYQLSSGVTYSYTWSLSAFSVGVNARYLMSLGKDMSFFVAGGPLVVPASISAPSSSGSGTNSVSAIGFGGQVQLGLDYYLADNFVVGPFAGFQLASVSGFTGSYSGSNGELYTYSNPPSGQYPIITAGPAGSPPSGTRPFAMDLSGPVAGIQVSAFF